MQQLTAEQIQQEAERRYPDDTILKHAISQQLFTVGATWATQQLQSANIPAEERAKELYPHDWHACAITDELQAAYITGHKEALQQGVSPVEFVEYCLQFDHTKQHGHVEWIVPNDDLDFPYDLKTTAELYKQYLQPLNK